MEKENATLRHDVAQENSTFENARTLLEETVTQLKLMQDNHMRNEATTYSHLLHQIAELNRDNKALHERCLHDATKFASVLSENHTLMTTNRKLTTEIDRLQHELSEQKTNCHCNNSPTCPVIQKSP